MEKKISTFDERINSKKIYKCLECNTTSHRKDWNDITEDYYGGEIISVAEVCGNENMISVCPYCFKEVYGNKIVKCK